MTPAVPSDVQHAWHLYVLQVNLSALSISRDRVIEELKERGIGTSVHFIPLHLHPYYQRHLGYRTGQFPQAEHHFEREISLPLFPGMTLDDADHVIEALLEAGAKIEDGSLAWLADQKAGSSKMKTRIAELLRARGARS